MQDWWRVGAVVRALAYHQWIGSISWPAVICGLSLLVLYSVLRGFSPGTLVFPSHRKSTFDLSYCDFVWFLVFSISKRLSARLNPLRLKWSDYYYYCLTKMVLDHCKLPIHSQTTLLSFINSLLTNWKSIHFKGGYGSWRREGSLGQSITSSSGRVRSKGQSVCSGEESQCGGNVSIVSLWKVDENYLEWISLVPHPIFEYLHCF